MWKLAIATMLALPSAAQEPPPTAPGELPSALVAARLPVLTDELREQQVSEVELRALLETALGSGVSLQALVGALEVVVSELEAGSDMPDLSLRLPGLIVQGFEGDALASMLRETSRTATAAVGAAPPAVEAPEATAEETVSPE